jgi:hypothetical protein
MKQALGRAERGQVGDDHRPAGGQHRGEQPVHAHEEIVVEVGQAAGGGEDQIEAPPLERTGRQLLGAPPPQLQALV